MVTVKMRIVAIYILIIVYSCSGAHDFDSSAKNFQQAKESFSKGKYTRAKSEFEYLILNDPLSKYATDSYFYIAESKYHLKQYSQAILDYEKYLSLPMREFTLSTKAEFMICKSWFNLSNDVLRDQTETMIAIDKLQYYIEKESLINYTEQISDMIFQLRNKLAEKKFKTAELYLQLGQSQGAEIYFKSIVNEFYDSHYLEDALLNVAYIKAETNKDAAVYYLETNRSFFESDDKFKAAISKIENKQ